MAGASFLDNRDHRGDLHERYQRINDYDNENMDPHGSWEGGFPASQNYSPRLSHTEPSHPQRACAQHTSPGIFRVNTTFPITSTPKVSTSSKQSPNVLGQFTPSPRQPMLKVPPAKTPSQSPPMRYSPARSPNEQSERIYAVEKANAAISSRLRLMEERCKTQEVATDQLSQELRDSREENKMLKVSVRMAEEQRSHLEMQLTNTVQHFSNQQQIREREMTEHHKQELEIKRQRTLKEQEEIANMQKEELKHQFTLRHNEELQRHRQKYEKDIASLKMAAAKSDQQIQGMKEERDVLTVHMHQKTTEQQNQVSELQQKLVDKCKEIEDAKYEAQNTTRIYLERHFKEQLEKTIKDLQDDHNRERTELITSSEQEQAELRDEISDKEAQLEEASERYANRDSREEDLEQIRQLTEQVGQLQRQASELIVFQEQNQLLAFPRNAYGDASYFSGFPQSGISTFNPNQESGYEAYRHAQEIEIREKECKLIELKSRISEHYENIEALEMQKQIREDEVNNTRAELEKVNVDKQQKEFALLKQRQFIEKSTKEFTNEKAKHAAGVLCLETKKRDIEAQLHKAKEELKNVEAQKAAAEQEQNDIMQRSNSELEQMEQMKLVQQQDIVKQVAESQTNEKQVVVTRQILMVVQAELKELNDTYEKTKKTCDTEIDKAKKDFKAIKDEQQKVIDELKQYNGQLHGAQQELQGIQADIETNTEQLKQYNGQLHGAQQELQGIQADIETKTEQMQRYTGLLDGANQNLQRIQADIKAKANEKNTIDQQLNSTKSELEKAKAELKAKTETAEKGKDSGVETIGSQSNQPQDQTIREDKGSQGNGNPAQ